jgi:hypothetical protein
MQVEGRRAREPSDLKSCGKDLGLGRVAPFPVGPTFAQCRCAFWLAAALSWGQAHDGQNFSAALLNERHPKWRRANLAWPRAESPSQSSSQRTWQSGKGKIPVNFSRTAVIGRLTTAPHPTGILLAVQCSVVSVACPTSKRARFRNDGSEIY